MCIWSYRPLTAPQITALRMCSTGLQLALQWNSVGMSILAIAQQQRQSILLFGSAKKGKWCKGSILYYTGDVRNSTV